MRSVSAEGKDVLAGDPGTVFGLNDFSRGVWAHGAFGCASGQRLPAEGLAYPEDAITSTRLIDYLGVLLEGSHP